MSLYNKPQYGTGSDTVAGNLNLAGDLVFSEQVDHSSTPSAGFGYLWTKNTAPTTLIFTDDTGADFTINASAGGFTSIIDDETDDNYAIGPAALDSLSSGTNNIAWGRNALTAATTGYNNVAIGEDAMSTLTNQYNNVAIGVDSAVVFNARDSVIIGFEACQQGGNNSTAVGATCMKTATSAYSTAVGYGALMAASGNSNVALGYGAGSGITSGTLNICIGYLGFNDLTTGDRCIGIGSYDFDSNTADDQLSIGGSAFGVPAINGYTGQFNDIDATGLSLTITGTSARASASTNLDAGDLILRGGLAATTGAGVGGDIFIRGGTKGSTGTDGDVYLADSNTDGLSFWNATPVAQQNGTGETTGFTAGSGTAVNDDSTFTGNVGSTAYRISDVVKALKNYGLLAS